MRSALALLAVFAAFVGCNAMKESRKGMSEAMYEAGGLLRPTGGGVSRTAREIERNTTRD